MLTGVVIHTREVEDSAPHAVREGVSVLVLNGRHDNIVA